MEDFDKDCEMRPVCEAEASQRQEEGAWVTSACYFGCGGRCVNRSLVKDGKVVRQKTDDLHPDSPDFPQQRGCPRGRTLRYAFNGTDRLRYPMKRKHWSPGGGKNVNGHLRGRDEWERISWDEAFDLIEQETKRIIATYGNRSIMATNYESRPLFDGLSVGAGINLIGGCTTTWGQSSQGAFPVVANMMKGSFNLGRMDCADRFSIRHAKLIVMWGNNTAYSAAGNPAYHYLQAKREGAYIVFVDPWCNPTAMALADEWIPLRPGTDTALLLAVAYELIVNGWHDQEFLDAYCVGFDADHMPQGADPKDNFKDYVLGTYDGCPKTPEWAFEICGVPPATTRHLAQLMGTVKPMSMKASQAPARTENGDTFVQAYYTVGWMTGNVGLPGAEVSAGIAGGDSAFGGPRLVMAGGIGYEMPKNPCCEGPRGGGALGRGEYDSSKYYGVCMSEMWDAVLTGRYHDFVHGVQPIDIRMITKIGVGHRMNQNPDFSKAVAAYRKVDFAVASDIWMNNDCLYSDIVLPAVSPYERDWTVEQQSNREALLATSKTVEPPDEARDDLWMQKRLVERWGVDPSLAAPWDMRQISFNQIAGAKVACGMDWTAHGDEHTAGAVKYENLVSITAEDLAALNVEGQVQEGRIPVRKFLEDGIYQIPRFAGDEYMHVPYAAFRQDPAGHPVPTESGKLEIYCPRVVEKYEEFGFTQAAPIAKYRAAKWGYEDTRTTEYPLQSISVHVISRAHSSLDNVERLNELFPPDLLVNALDAEELGISQGDWVLATSPYGKTLQRVQVTNLMMPGVVCVGQGAWADLCDQNGIDYAGCANTIQGSPLAGEGQSNWNTSVLRLEPWEGPVPPTAGHRPRRVAAEGMQKANLTLHASAPAAGAGDGHDDGALPDNAIGSAAATGGCGKEAR